MPNNTPPLLPIAVFICLSPFKIQILTKNFLLRDIVKTKLNLNVCKSFFLSSQSDVLKELWVPILKGLKPTGIVLLKTNSFKTLLGYSTNGHLVPLLASIKTRDYHYSLAASMLRTGWGRGESFFH